MGFFAGLNDEKYDRQYTDRVLVSRMVNYFNTQVSRLVYASITIIALAFIGAALPVVVSRMLDVIRDQPTTKSIAIAGGLLVGVGVGQWGLNWLRRGLIVRPAGVVCNAARRSEKKGGPDDVSLHSECATGGTLVAAAPTAVYFGHFSHGSDELLTVSASHNGL